MNANTFGIHPLVAELRLILREGPLRRAELCTSREGIVAWLSKQLTPPVLLSVALFLVPLPLLWPAAHAVHSMNVNVPANNRQLSNKQVAYGAEWVKLTMSKWNLSRMDTVTLQFPKSTCAALRPMGLISNCGAIRMMPLGSVG